MIGDLFHLRSWTDIHSDFQFGYKVEDKKSVAVMLHLGYEPKDGSERLDVDAALLRLGYKRVGTRSSSKAKPK